ncbi:phosphocholine cytidylyltransferase family protein [Photobacterium sanguinicancri]|uniref:phosphocholine cytidylyltransferase family protein n=1 Tax=Photobacterium sanguinicancri TaxID=875932 RepID=UPI0021C43739|nr:sugar phosphate nucleotidyltransferase [Photobacterium sanguinicancri]
MKTIIILAAGIGSRLRPITESVPKSLVPVAGVPLLERLVLQILNNSKEHNIVVVAGYFSEQIITSMDNLSSSIKVVVNNDYDKTNNMESCRMGLEAVEYNDCVIVNADCIYEDGVVNRMLNSVGSCIGIDSSEYFEENMKVMLINDHVVEISKSLPEQSGNFTSIDIYNFVKSDTDELLNIMRSYHDRGDLQKWNEVAINDVVKNTPVTVIDFNGLGWVEIDNHDDLNKAEAIFK